MRLNITSSKITSEKMIKATREGFEKSTDGNIVLIGAEVEKIYLGLNNLLK